NKPFGWILESIAGLVGGNFAASIFLFTLLINLILIPLSIKSQKSSVQQTRIKPKLDELKKRYGDDKQRYNAEMQKLYQEENVSMSGGCLPLILRLIFMMSIYWIILSPLTYLMHIDKNVISEAVKTLGTTAKSGSELAVIDAVRNGTIDSPAIAKALESINFEFFGINLTQTPNFSFNIFKDFQTIWIMPIIAFGAQILSSLLSMAMQKKINPDAPSMNSMLLMMPLISLFIGFSLPGGVTFYWACSSLIGGLIQTGIQFYYGPHKMLARERIKELKKQSAFEEGQIKKLGSTETE
ncbi:MAG: YidC/Oxa1 family membrane protein insertase, partial [Acutalibacteraceae bacterium]|nr:YidC/Oxa1 family membrane protein insertase [Acutalibacteraceae bacterium]